MLSFDTAEDLDRALASPEWAAAVAQVGSMRGRRIAVMGEEAELFPPPPIDLGPHLIGRSSRRPRRARCRS